MLAFRVHATTCTQAGVEASEAGKAASQPASQPHLWCRWMLSSSGHSAAMRRQSGRASGWRRPAAAAASRTFRQVACFQVDWKL